MTDHACSDTVLACRNLHTIEAAAASSLLASSQARRAIKDRSQRWSESLTGIADIHAVLEAWSETASTWGADSGVLKPSDWDDLSVSIMQDARRAFAEQATDHVQQIVLDATDYLQERIQSAVTEIPGLATTTVEAEVESYIPVDFMFGWDDLAKSGGGIAKDIFKRGTLGPTLAGGAGSGAVAMGAVAQAGALRAALGMAAAGLPAVGAVYEWSRLKSRLRDEIVSQLTAESDRLGMHLRGAVSDASSRAIDLLAGPVLAQLDTRDKHLGAALQIARDDHASIAT